MGAYNWVRFDARCPRCEASSPIKAQCHIASSYDGDDSGRFHNRIYVVGQTMAWWPRTDRRWPSWTEENRAPSEGQEGVVRECCYANCETCGAELYAVIEFRDLTVVRIVDVGIESLWPADYLR
jgi:hypothetical protein